MWALQAAEGASARPGGAPARAQARSRSSRSLAASAAPLPVASEARRALAIRAASASAAAAVAVARSPATKRRTCALRRSFTTACAGRGGAGSTGASLGPHDVWQGMTMPCGVFAPLLSRVRRRAGLPRPPAPERARLRARATARLPPAAEPRRRPWRPRRRSRRRQATASPTQPLARRPAANSRACHASRQPVERAQHALLMRKGRRWST